MNKEMRKFYKKLRKMNNEGVTFKKFDGKLISDFEAEDLNIPEGYSIVDNEIYSGDIKIGEFEVASFEENEDIDLSEFEDLDVDYEEDEEETRRFSIRNGLNAVRYGISNFFGNLGKRKEISIDDDITDDITEEVEEIEEVEENSKNIKNSLDINEIFNEISKLNPSVNMEYDSINEKLILLGVKPEELKLPEGFYYNEKNGITNKHNTESGEYIAFGVEVLNDENTNQNSNSKSTEGNNSHDINNNLPIEDDDDFVDDIEIEYREPKRVKVFRKLKGAVLLAGSAIRNFFYGIANNTSKFFENFGKRKEILIDEDILGDDDDIIVDENTSNNKKSSKNSGQSNNLEELKKKMNELSIRFAELENLTTSKIKTLDDETKEKYAFVADTANSMLLGLTKEQMIEMYKNGGNESLTNYFSSNFTLEEKIKRVEAAIKYLEDVNKSLDKDIEKLSKKGPSASTVIRNYLFNSEEDVRSKFKEFNNYDELEEKIKYYEEFLKNHDLSHPDDQPMKERMEQKLAGLKNIYEENSKNANDNRSEKMAYYTQMSMGIDKKIDRMNKERQLKLLQAELDGKTMVNLGLAEERKIDEEKIKLLRLKRECLERKAEVNKYYEEKAARMTEALKR